MSLPKAFSYLCDCGHLTRKMSHKPKKWVKCQECGKRSMRDFSAPNVIQDTLSAPLGLSTLLPTRDLAPGEKPKGWDTVDSRTGIKRAMERHDRKYGTKLEHL